MKKQDNLIIDDFSLISTLMGQKQNVKPTVGDEDYGVDYSSEYKKQTGRDFETGEYVTH